MEPMKRWQLKLSAKEQLRGAWGNMALKSFLVTAVPLGIWLAATMLCFVIFLMGGTFSALTSRLNNFGSVSMGATSVIMTVFMVICYIAVILCEILLSLGFTDSCIKLRSGERTGAGVIFSKFSMFPKVIKLTLFLLIPLVPYLVISVISTSFDSVWTFLLAILALAAFIYIILRASMCIYILLENPYTTVWQAIKQSFNMMRGHCGRYFVLLLSFYGWMLLAGITIIGVFWLTPYMEMTNVNFYYDLKRYTLENQ